MKLLNAPKMMAVAGLAVAYAFPLAAQRNTAPNVPGWDMDVGSGAAVTQISGDAGTANVVDGPDGMVLTALEFFERSDRPCRIVAHFRSWSLDSELDVEDVDSQQRSDGQGNCTGSKKIVGAGVNGGAVTGIQLCQRRQNDRLKGARTHAKKPTPNGLEDATGTNFDRPNCNEWQSLVECASGRVATGIVVHWNNAAINGIALRCSRVSWDRQPFDRIGNVNRGYPRLTTSGNFAGTGISGLSATEEVLEAPAPNMVLKRITFGERNDRPCYIQAVFWTNNPTETNRPVTFDECNGNHGSELTVEIPSNPSTMQLPSSIAICRRQANDRLKGIRLLGSRVAASGTTPDPAISAEEDRPNCNNNWVEPPAHCNATYLITALRVHYRPSSNRPAEIVGLGPNCSLATLER